MNKKAGMFLCIGITIISCMQCVLLEASVISTQNNSKERIAFINEEDSEINTNVGLGEYIHVDENGNWVDIGGINEYYTNNPGIEVLEFKKEYTNVSIRVKNNTNDVGLVTLPLFYYLGYSARELNTGEAVEVFKSSNGRVMFIVEGGGSERYFKLEYTGKKLWKVCEGISFVCFFGIVLWSGFLWRKKYLKKSVFELLQ